ncbi:MAG: hypothetical protein HY913_16200 [Desulfomonile tiedjei]|nr:hypothetical protein [Desulfomonile tiedjei]
MKRETMFSATAILLALAGFAYCFQVRPADSPTQAAGGPQYGNIDLFQGASGRDDCLRDCRERYGVMFGPNDPRANLYARCVQECEQQFWQDFDRREKDLEQQK